MQHCTMLSRVAGRVSPKRCPLLLLAFLCTLHHVAPAMAGGGGDDGDKVVNIQMSFYTDAGCEKPIQLDENEPLVMEFEVDSSKKYEHCRKEAGNSSKSTWYEFWCHENGEEISGKILCKSEKCEECEVDSSMKGKDGSSLFPFGEMRLGKCTRLPEDNSTWIKFDGSCPNTEHSPVLVIVLSVTLSLLGLCCVGLFVFAWKRRRASQSRWYTSDTGSSSSSGYRPPMFGSA